MNSHIFEEGYGDEYDKNYVFDSHHEREDECNVLHISPFQYTTKFNNPKHSKMFLQFLKSLNCLIILQVQLDINLIVNIKY